MENVGNSKDKFIKKDEVTYDGKIISAYDIDKMIVNKMKYIIDMCNTDNYVFDKEVAKEIFGEYFEYANNFDITINKNGSIGVVFYSFVYSAKLEFNIFLKDNIISYKFKNYYFLKKIYESNAMYEHEYKDVIKFSNDNRVKKAERFIENFIKDNQEILLNLLQELNEYDVIDKYEQTIIVDDCKLYYLFDLLRKETKTFLTLGNYEFEKNEDILKRISINIEELNPFFQNEIDKYYNCINDFNYKCYKKIRVQKNTNVKK